MRRPWRPSFAEILRDSGYSVLEAPSSQVALQIASDYSGAIELLVTDVVMPGLRGPNFSSAFSHYNRAFACYSCPAMPKAFRKRSFRMERRSCKNLFICGATGVPTLVALRQLIRANE
jgi:hypothetical protein